MTTGPTQFVVFSSSHYIPQGPSPPQRGHPGPSFDEFFAAAARTAKMLRDRAVSVEPQDGQPIFSSEFMARARCSKDLWHFSQVYSYSGIWKASEIISIIVGTAGVFNRLLAALLPGTQIIRRILCSGGLQSPVKFLEGNP